MNKERIKAGIDLVDELTDAELNELVDYIRASYKFRKQKRDSEARLQMRKGTKVRLAGNRKPQYLEGQTGVIEEMRSTRVLIALDCGPIGKFRSGKVLTNPGGLEVIE